MMMQWLDGVQLPVSKKVLGSNLGRFRVEFAYSPLCVFSPAGFVSQSKKRIEFLILEHDLELDPRDCSWKMTGHLRTPSTETNLD